MGPGPHLRLPPPRSHPLGHLFSQARQFPYLTPSESAPGLLPPFRRPRLSWLHSRSPRLLPAPIASPSWQLPRLCSDLNPLLVRRAARCWPQARVAARLFGQQSSRQTQQPQEKSGESCTVYAMGMTRAPTDTSLARSSKRAVGTHKVFRRRAAVPSPSTSPQEPMGRPAEESSLLSYIPGVRRHRKLSNRSRLWSFI